MVKLYQRYVGQSVFGVIGSPGGTTDFDRTGQLLCVPLLSDVGVWHVRRGSLIRKFVGPQGKEVTFICRSPDDRRIAAGYSDGSIRLWVIDSGVCEGILRGHSKAVTSLAFSSDGAVLVSGSKDCKIAVWDTVDHTGICRLAGHTGPVLSVAFLSESKSIVSGGSDGLVKVWDTASQHCTHTLVGHQAEVWSVVVDRSESLIVAGSSDRVLRVWNIGRPSSESEDTPIVFLGVLTRAATASERVQHLAFSPLGSHLVCVGAGRSVEFFRLRTLDEAKRKVRRRNKKKQEDAVKSNESQGLAVEKLGVEDLLTPILVHRGNAKVRSVAFNPTQSSSKKFQVACLLSNNSIELVDLSSPVKGKLSASPGTSVTVPGHRGEIRALSVGSERQLVASVSNESVKLWNLESQQCVRTFEVENALSCMFLPGERHVLVGTKTGELCLLGEGAVGALDTILAHKGEVWEVMQRPASGFVASLGGSSVRLWSIKIQEVDQKGNDGEKRISRVKIVEEKTISCRQGVLAGRFTPDGKRIAVALLDFSVSVLEVPSGKTALSLYGHTLPVLTVDISSDGALCASGSVDKNIRLWSMGFGDCIRSLFAHAEPVTRILFVPNTHYLFSCARDGSVRNWDADSFEMISEVGNHSGEVLALASSSDGSTVLSGGRDRSIRRWERTEDLFVLEEERLNEVSKMEESVVSESIQPDGEKEATFAVARTSESLRAGEQLYDTLESAREELESIEEEKDGLSRLQNSLLAKEKNIALAKQEEALYERVWSIVRRLNPSDAEDGLLTLPFASVVVLLRCLDAKLGESTEILRVCRLLLFTVRAFYAQLIASEPQHQLLVSLHQKASTALRSHMDTVGFNLAALKLLKSMSDENSTARLGLQERKAVPMDVGVARGVEKSRKRKH